VPYSILGFRIERGGDRKRCLEVILKGEFTQSDEFKNVGVKVNNQSVFETICQAFSFYSNFTMYHRMQTSSRNFRFKNRRLDSPNSKSDLMGSLLRS
jgi:hypothetical protein